MIKAKWVGTRRQGGGFLLAGLAMASVAVGCGLFEIREPSKPIEPGGGPPRAAPVAPESVLFNFTQAVRYQLDGLGQYEESLWEQYFLVLDQLDVIDIGIPGIDSLSRSRDTEAQRLRSQESPADSFFFAFGDAEPERIGSTAFYQDLPYELQILVPDGDSLKVNLILRGKVDLNLAEVQAGKWVITRWADEREDPFVSFGRWHAEQVGSQAPPRSNRGKIAGLGVDP